MYIYILVLYVCDIYEFILYVYIEMCVIYEKKFILDLVEILGKCLWLFIKG